MLNYTDILWYTGWCAFARRCCTVFGVVGMEVWVGVGVGVGVVTRRKRVPQFQVLVLFV